jgi:hypothetical protein
LHREFAVGQSTSTCVCLRSTSIMLSAGRPKAAVLPEPVCERPTISAPDRAAGMVSA